MLGKWQTDSLPYGVDLLERLSERIQAAVGIDSAATCC